MWLSYKSKRKARKSRTKRTKKVNKRKSSRLKSRRKSRRVSRHRFGVSGPGYKGATSFQNGYANYFGASEPFVNASEWFYPNPGTKGGMIGSKPTNYQSPKMLSMYNKFGKKKSRRFGVRY